MIGLFVRNMVMKFGRWARWTDLTVGMASVAAGMWFGYWWLIALGIVSMFAFSIDLNGKIQKWAIARAQKHVVSRRS